MENRALSTHDKALQINIDAGRYGTFAEIGAGQEVARWFFHVSRQRLQAMLDHEWSLLLERLDSSRGAKTRFFVFADTVAARSWSRTDEGLGWLGIRFQTESHGRPSQIIIHARMWDLENARQQEALGMLGVNLIHPETLIGSLMDGLTRDRMEVDMIKFSGQRFEAMDNRVLSLQLVQQRLTNAALFAPDGEVVEPAELLHGMPVLIERGSFRPITRVTLDLLDQAQARMRAEPGADGREPVALMEMTLRNLMALDERVDHADFLARMDTLRELGRTVMISNYSRFHNVTTYLRRYTKDRIGMVLGVPTLAQIFEEKHYADLDGGILEALGRLVGGGPVRLYVYPFHDTKTGLTVTAETFALPGHLSPLYAHLRESGRVVSIDPGPGFDAAVLPRDVLAMLRAGNPGWEPHVPEEVRRLIKERRLFGYSPPLSSAGV